MDDEFCEMVRAAKLPLDPEDMLPAVQFFRQGKGDLAHTSTSPEMLELCPPKVTFRQFVARYYAKH
jgi:hypothetical protein